MIDYHQKLLIVIMKWAIFVFLYFFPWIRILNLRRIFLSRIIPFDGRIAIFFAIDADATKL